MLCAPNNLSSIFVFCPFSRDKLTSSQKSVLNMGGSDSQIDKPQRGRPKRAELPDVNINTGAQSINTEKSLFKSFKFFYSRIILSHKFNFLADSKFSVLSCHFKNFQFLS